MRYTSTTYMAISVLFVSASSMAGTAETMAPTYGTNVSRPATTPREIGIGVPAKRRPVVVMMPTAAIAINCPASHHRNAETHRVKEPFNLSSQRRVEKTKEQVGIELRLDGEIHTDNN